MFNQFILSAKDFFNNVFASPWGNIYRRESTLTGYQPSMAAVANRMNTVSGNSQPGQNESVTDPGELAVVCQIGAYICQDYKVIGDSVKQGAQPIPSMETRLAEKEAYLLSILKNGGHPNVVQPLSYTVFEYNRLKTRVVDTALTACRLHDVIFSASEPAWLPTMIVTHINQIYSAIKYLYMEHDIVHLGLEPRNILLSFKGRCIITGVESMIPLNPKKMVPDEEDIIFIQSNPLYTAPELLDKQLLKSLIKIGVEPSEEGECYYSLFEKKRKTFQKKPLAAIEIERQHLMALIRDLDIDREVSTLVLRRKLGSASLFSLAMILYQMMRKLTIQNDDPNIKKDCQNIFAWAKPLIEIISSKRCIIEDVEFMIESANTHSEEIPDYRLYGVDEEYYIPQQAVIFDEQRALIASQLERYSTMSAHESLSRLSLLLLFTEQPHINQLIAGLKQAILNHLRQPQWVENLSLHDCQILINLLCQCQRYSIINEPDVMTCNLSIINITYSMYGLLRFFRHVEREFSSKVDKNYVMLNLAIVEQLFKTLKTRNYMSETNDPDTVELICRTLSDQYLRRVPTGIRKKPDGHSELIMTTIYQERFRQHQAQSQMIKATVAHSSPSGTIY